VSLSQTFPGPRIPMTSSLAMVHAVLTAATSKSTTNPLITLGPLLAIGVLGYFFFIRPQQRKAQAARQQKSSGIEVGDEVQTVGGVIGTVLEIHGDRYTLLTGALGDDGNLDGPQPTRIVFVRQAIAKKIEPVEDVRLRDQPVEDDEEVDDDSDSDSDADGDGVADVHTDGDADEEIHDIRPSRGKRRGGAEGAIGDVRDRGHDDEGGTASEAEEA
jgi:preprotein translocase YajC subunit